MIMLFDFLEREPAPAADPVPVLPLVIPEEMVGIPDLEEIRQEVEVQVLSRETVILEEEAGPPTRRPASNEEVSSCQCPREGSPSNLVTPDGSRPSKRTPARVVPYRNR